MLRWFGDVGLTYYNLFQVGMGGSGSGIVWKHTSSNPGRSLPIVQRIKHIAVFSRGEAIQRTAMTGLYWCNSPDKNYHHWGQSVNSHRYYIDCLGSPGDLVLDPFCGGGTTGIACAVLDRRYLLFDLDPVAIKTTAARLNDDSYPLECLPLFKGNEGDAMTSPSSPRVCACGRKVHCRGMCKQCYNRADRLKHRQHCAHHTGNGQNMMKLSQERINANIERIVAAAIAAGTCGVDADAEREIWACGGPLKCRRVG